MRIQKSDGFFCTPTRALLVLAAMVMAGCTALPNSGPTASQLIDGANSAGNTLGFKVVDIDAAVSRQLALEHGTPVPLPFGTDGGDVHAGKSRLPGVDEIGPGDSLSISIFEIGTSLFSGGGSSMQQLPPLGSSGTAGPAPSAAGENLPPIVVARDGTIDVPYVGSLVAARHTPSELEAMIRQGLRSKSENPQVVVSVHDSVASTVIVMGDVKKPGRLPLTLAREHLLDMIALAGGINSDNENMMQDEVVRLTRDGRAVQLPLADLHADSADNIAMQPQDRVEVIHQPRTYTVLGATGKVSQVPFSAAEVSLAEAVARVGGPSDQQADPTAVFLFRDVSSSDDVADPAMVPATASAASTGKDIGTTDAAGSHETSAAVAASAVPRGAAAPVIYRLDMMNPQSYFLAQRFAVRDKDLIYIANAESDNIAKFLSMVNLVFQPFYTGRLVTQH
jgi:polysaccharide export outer membrane protein